MADMKRAEREAKKEADKAEKITTATAKAALAGTDDTLMELKMDIVMKNKSASSSMIIEKKVQIIVLSK